MKVLQVVNHFVPCTGGKESVVKELSLRLKQAGHDVQVACLNKCAEGGKKLPATGKWNGIEIKRVGFLNFGLFKIGFPKLGLFKETEMVHAHGICFLTDYAALMKPFYRKPLVLSTHGGIFHTKQLGFFKKIYFFGWLRLIAGAFDKVIAVSRNDFELFSKVFPKEKMVLVENAADVERFKGIKRKDSGNSFLFVGRLSRNKRVDLLIEAFAAGPAGKKGAKLSIVGKDFDGMLPELREKAKQLGVEKSVVFEGAVSDEKMLKLLSAHRFFASASEYEGFGITAIEAMAAGLVPVLNDIPSFKGFVQNGKNGFITSFADSGRAGKAMLAACGLNGKRLEAVRENARTFAQGFSWKKKVKEFEKAYNSVLWRNP